MTDGGASRPFRIRWLGRVRYRYALALQQRTRKRTAGNTVLPAVILVGLGRFELPTFGPPVRLLPGQAGR